MDSLFTVTAMVALVAVFSTVVGRVAGRKHQALWVWNHLTPLGWALIAAGTLLIVFGFVVDGSGTAMSTKLGLGSLLLVAGLWMIW